MSPVLRRLVRFALVLCVALALWGSALAGPRGRRGRPAERRLRDMASLRSAAEHHPYTRRILRRVKSDRLRMIESVGDVSARRIAERAGWVPLGADPELRRVTVATVERKIRQRSRRLRRLIKARQGEAAWDVVFIGAGVHTAIAANTLANLETNDPVHMLTIEASNDIGGTFREVGSTVSRNSANRTFKRGAALRRGFGDKNPSEGPWGDPDLSGQEWPALGILADTATVNLFASGSDVLLGERVERIEFRDQVADSASWPARYRLTMSDGGVVYANAVARATGLGKPVLKGVDQATQQLIEAERKTIDFDKPDQVPDILFYKDALKLASRSHAGRDPYRAAAVPPRRFVELKGLRVTTSQPAELRATVGNETRAIPLEQVLGFTFDSGAKTWTVELDSGERLQSSRLVAQVANRELVPQAGETLDTLADQIAKLDIPGGMLSVRKRAVSRRIREPVPAAQRLDAVRERAGNAANLAVLTGQQEPLTGIADIRAKTADVLTVVRTNGSSVDVQSPLRLFSNGQQVGAIEARDPAIQDPNDPVRPVIAVVGGRDSGRTFLEYLYGQGPAAAYNGHGKIDSAQRGEIGDVEWYVGDSGPADCAQFLQSTRSRYLRLTGKVRDVGDGSQPRARLEKARVTAVRKLGNGRYQITDSRGQNRVVDRVIFATGFENAENEDGQLEPIRGAVSGLSGERTLAKRVAGRDIFRFGPAAGTDVVEQDERYSTNENAGSIYAFAPRDRQFAREVLARTLRSVTVPDVASIERPERVRLAEGDSSAVVERSVRGRRLETPLSDLAIRSEMLDVLAAVRGAPSRGELSFRVERDASSGKLKVEGLNHQGAEQIAALIADSALLCDQLEAATEDGDTVEVRVPLVNGRPQRTKLKIQM